MRFFSLLLIVASFSVASFSVSPAFASHCYKLELRDENDAAIPVSPPAVGLMLGGVPILNGAYPTHAKRVPVAPVDCPDDLVESVRLAYNASCVTEEARKKSAETAQRDMSIIIKGCDEMNYALLGKDVEFYRKKDEKLFPKTEEGMFPRKPGIK